MTASSFFASTKENKSGQEYKGEQLTPISFYGQRETIIADLFHLIAGRHFNRFLDPLAGSGSISLAAMQENLSNEYFMNDACTVLKYVWESIRSFPQEFIVQYKKYVENYCELPTEMRNEFYQNKLMEFNKASKVGQNFSAAILFVFLMQFAEKNMPLYDKDLNLNTSAKLQFSVAEEKANLETFMKRTTDASVLMNKNRIHFASEDFLTIVKLAHPGDIVIFDPPYPTHESSLYFKNQAEKELQQNLRAAFHYLNKQKIPFITLYGARILSLDNQFDEEECEVQHLLKISVSRVHGEGLEHIYVSRSLPLSSAQLPKTMAFYHDFCKSRSVMSKDEYQVALDTLRLKRDATNSSTKSSENRVGISKL